jgi:hypothetical protein
MDEPNRVTFLTLTLEPILKKSKMESEEPMAMRLKMDILEPMRITLRNENVEPRLT